MNIHGQRFSKELFPRANQWERGGEDRQDKEPTEANPGVILSQVPALTWPWESCGIEVMPQTLPQL